MNSYPGPTGLTSDGLDDLVDSDPSAASLQGRHYSRLSQLHGACFYTGACNQHTERRINETADYIAGAEILAAGSASKPESTEAVGAGVDTSDDG